MAGGRRIYEHGDCRCFVGIKRYCDYAGDSQRAGITVPPAGSAQSPSTPIKCASMTPMTCSATAQQSSLGHDVQDAECRKDKKGGV